MNSFWILRKKYVKIFLKFESIWFLDAGSDLEEKFFIGFVILSDFVGSDDSDWVVVLDGMSFFRKETFFSILVVGESDVTMVDVRFNF